MFFFHRNIFLKSCFRLIKNITCILTFNCFFSVKTQPQYIIFSFFTYMEHQEYMNCVCGYDKWNNLGGIRSKAYIKLKICYDRCLFLQRRDNYIVYVVPITLICHYGVLVFCPEFRFMMIQFCIYFLIKHELFCFFTWWNT